MDKQKVHKRIEKLRNRNIFLTIEINQLSIMPDIEDNKKRISGNFEEISSNKLEIQSLENLIKRNQ